MLRTGAKHTSCPGACSEHLGQVPSERRPAVSIELRRQGHVRQAGGLEELRVEPRLQGADGDVLAVRRLVDVVEGRAPVEQVAASLVSPGAGLLRRVEHGHQVGDAVHHGRIHHLALSGPLPLEQRAHHAEGEKQAAAAEVGDQVEG
jgi:hypothetical protein